MRKLLKFIIDKELRNKIGDCWYLSNEINNADAKNGKIINLKIVNKAFYHKEVNNNNDYLKNKIILNHKEFLWKF